MAWQLALGAGLTGLSALSKYIQGNKQGKLADQYANTPRPTRTTSPYLYQNQGIAQNIAGGGLPGEGLLKNRLDRIIATQTNAAANAGYGTPDILASISSGTDKLLDYEGGITGEANKYRQYGQGLLMNAHQQLATEDQLNWDWNKKQKYLDTMAASSALKNASMLNKQGAIEDVAKIPLLFGDLGKSKVPNNNLAQQYQDENTKYIQRGMNNSTIYDNVGGSYT